MRCEGWRRYGGAFSFGPAKWEQCESDAIVNLTVRQADSEEEVQPACKACWIEAVGNAGIEILKAEPLEESPE